MNLYETCLACVGTGEVHPILGSYETRDHEITHVRGTVKCSVCGGTGVVLRQEPDNNQNNKDNKDNNANS